MQVKSLLALQRKGGGVIELNEKVFQQLLVGKSRPYSVVLVAGEAPGCTGERQGDAPGAAADRPPPPLPLPPHGLMPLPALLPTADAKNLRSQGKLRLGHLMSEFKLAGKAMAATHAGKESAGAVFFALVEFTAAKELFGK